MEVVTLRGEEFLLFHTFPVDVAVIRGTTADEDGNLTMEGEAVQGEMLAMAMAARNTGGITIAQVKRLAPRGSLPLRDVKVPGALVDYVFVDPDQWQTYVTQDSPYYAGALRRPVTPEPPLPLDVRKIIARRSLLEFPRGAICNLGLRDQPAHRAGGLGGGHHRPAGAHRGAGHLRRGPGRRQRGRGRVQLPGDDRPAVHVRLLRGRRARRRQPLVRGGGRAGQRQRPRVRGPRPGSRRLPEHQREDREDQLRRDAHGAGAGAGHRRGRRPRRARGQPREVRARGARDLVQRDARAAARPAGAVRHGPGGVRARGRRAGAHRGGARHRRRARRPRADGLPAARRRRTSGRPTAASTPTGPMGLAADFAAAAAEGQR